jgi:hypothetical protein
MKINFTKKEYRILLDLIHIADWILHAHDSEPRNDTKEYSDLIQKLMSHAKDMDCGDLIEFDKQLGKYFPSIKFEEESIAEKYIEEFEDNSFWSELITRLAERDALTETKANNLNDIEIVERMTAISNEEEKWAKEFETYGLKRIRTSAIQHDAIH